MAVLPSFKVIGLSSNIILILLSFFSSFDCKMSLDHLCKNIGNQVFKDGTFVAEKITLQNIILRAVFQHTDEQTHIAHIYLESVLFGVAVQRRFGLRGKVVGYHGIQSFREGEVTPERAFAIGKETHRDYLREDVEYCLSFATNPREFESQLYALGYTLDPVRFSVKAKHWERAVRLNA